MRSITTRPSAIEWSLKLSSLEVLLAEASFLLAQLTMS